MKFKTISQVHQESHLDKLIDLKDFLYCHSFKMLDNLWKFGFVKKNYFEKQLHFLCEFLQHEEEQSYLFQLKDLHKYLFKMYHEEQETHKCLEKNWKLMNITKKQYYSLFDMRS